MTKISRRFSELQSGYVYHYAFITLVGATALLSLAALAVASPRWMLLFQQQLDLGEGGGTSNALYFVLTLTFYYLAGAAAPARR